MDSGRRDFTKGVAALALMAGAPAGAKAGPAQSQGLGRDWSKLRGFNYHPSYATNLIETWTQFDARLIATELERGKEHFPRINVLRWWHSWDAFSRDPRRYVDNFRKAVDLSEKVGCAVTCTLFNRTHLPPLDFGGIYIDHFLPGSALNIPGMFDNFLHEVVGGLAEDPRIIAWDLCNEPYWYQFKYPGRIVKGPAVPHAVFEAETAFLRHVYDRCKEVGARAPLTVAAWGTGHVPLELVNPVSDVLSIHAYFNDGKKDNFGRQLDQDIVFARKTGKPLFVSECCWGNLDDLARVRDSSYELEEISRRGLGFLAYVMHHSRMPDSHGVDGGPVGMPADLSFIKADGVLRTGHEFFNRF